MGDSGPNPNEATRISRDSEKQALQRAEEALARLRTHRPRAGLSTDVVLMLCRGESCWPHTRFTKTTR